MGAVAPDRAARRGRHAAAGDERPDDEARVFVWQRRLAIDASVLRDQHAAHVGTSALDDDGSP
jgi:hypothetical protein